MKKAMLIAIPGLIVSSILLFAGGASGSRAGTPIKQLRVGFVVPGNLGDLGFNDSAESGIKMAASKLGAVTKTVEGGTDANAWLADLQGMSRQNYNIVVSGSAQAEVQMTSVAKQFPNQHYFSYDQTIAEPNVASIIYLQNDGAFLAGVLAGLVTTNPKLFPLAKGSDTVGLLAGANIPVIQDFIVGFKRGVQTVSPKIKVLVSYVGSFTDPVTGYNQSVDMFNRGADVVFVAAGPSGLGGLKASKVQNRYSIGVDGNQNGTYPGHVLASDLKNIGGTIFSLLQKYKAGTLQFGKNYVFGLSNNGVGLVIDNALVPASIRSKIATYTAQAASGKIVVPCVNPYCLKATS